MHVNYAVDYWYLHNMLIMTIVLYARLKRLRFSLVGLVTTVKHILMLYRL